MQKIELGSIFVDYEDTTPPKSVLEDSKSVSSETESEFEESKSESEILQSDLETYQANQNPLKNFNAWLLIKYGVQFFVVAVFAENVKDLSDESMLSVMIFLFALASYPILLIAKHQKFSLKTAEFEAEIAKNQASERVGEELVRQKTLDYKNAFLKSQELNKTLEIEVKRLQNIEERFVLLQKESEETAQQRTAYLNKDISNRGKLENALREFKILEAEKTELINALDTESTERQRLASEVNSLSKQVETLTVQNERLFNEVQTLTEQNKTFENLIAEFVSYEKTLVNGVAPLGSEKTPVKERPFIKTYLSILEKCKGGAK